jgi:energy-coupling factor transporter ATP-binding protein EcfA2
MMETRTLTPKPDFFNSVEQYCKAFEPFIFEETRAAIATAIETKSGSDIAKCRVQKWKRPKNDKNAATITLQLYPRRHGDIGDTSELPIQPHDFVVLHEQPTLENLAQQKHFFAVIDRGNTDLYGIIKKKLRGHDKHKNQSLSSNMMYEKRKEERKKRRGDKGEHKKYKIHGADTGGSVIKAKFKASKHIRQYISKGHSRGSGRRGKGRGRAQSASNKSSTGSDTWYICPLFNLVTKEREYEAIQRKAVPTAFFDIFKKPKPTGNKKEPTLENNIGQGLMEYFYKNYNESQINAICQVLNVPVTNQRVHLILGPPGAGKTSTLSALLSALLASGKKERVLVCSGQNVAIDHVVKRVMKDGLYNSNGNQYFLEVNQMARIGNDEKIDPYSIAIDPATRFKQLIKMIRNISDGIKSLVTEKMEIMDKLKNANTPYKARQSIKSRKSRIEETMQNIADTIAALLDTKLVNTEQVSRIRDKFTDVRISMGKFLEQTDNEVRKIDIMNEAETTFSMIDILHKELELYLQVDNRDVELKILDHVTIVFATMAITGRHVLRKMRPFTTLIIDEAAQITESESMIPLDLVNCDNKTGRLVLIGDHKQLPSTVISTEATDKNYAQSLFERLILKVGLPHTMLDTQYRMHPLISSFPESRFYQKQLHDGLNVKDYDRDPYWSIKYNHGLPPCAFINCTMIEGSHSQQLERFIPGIKSYGNDAEADAIVQIIDALTKKLKIPHSNICVITFYRGQVDIIRKKLATHFPEESEKQRIDIEQRILKSRRVNPTLSGGVDVNTVDSYQGSEKEVIILSTVRSNIKGNLGFLNDERRLNVALTRAKYSLLICGHGQTLVNGGALWKEYLRDVDVLEPDMLIQSTIEIQNQKNPSTAVLSNPTGPSVLELSIRRKDLQLASTLLKNTQFKNDLLGAVYAAIDTDNSSLLKYILEHKDKKQRLINTKDKTSSQNNLLHRASLFGSTQVAKVLIAKKPDLVFELNSERSQALHLIAKSGDKNMFELVFNAMRENPNWQEKALEQQQLFHPQQVNDIATLNKFCVQDNDGNTPLHIAIIRNNPDIVSILVHGRAMSKSITNNDGKTVTQLAQESGHRIIIKMI